VERGVFEDWWFYDEEELPVARFGPEIGSEPE
jgi:hypothetical protein